VIGLYVLVLTVAVIYASLTCAATHQAPDVDQDAIPGTTVACATTGCDQARLHHRRRPPRLR